MSPVIGSFEFFFDIEFGIEIFLSLVCHIGGSFLSRGSMSYAVGMASGAEYVADFIARNCFDKVFLVTGGACAFIVDAIGQREDLDLICFQHEQAAAMAADAVWRVNNQVAVTLATSGPGATNLLTGIACSYFDSIPTIHITGQVNTFESDVKKFAAVRQAGFQETDVVAMAKPITKWSKRVGTISELPEVLSKAIRVATIERPGPVLIDIPMDVQKSSIEISSKSKTTPKVVGISTATDAKEIKSLMLALSDSIRPLVLIGAGAGVAGKAQIIQKWCKDNYIPFVTSWGGVTFVDRTSIYFLGSVGVYGSRLANWAVQSADVIATFGSRLDNRQRTSDPRAFAPFAKIFVLDIDQEELKKFSTASNYTTYHLDLKNVEGVLCPLDGNVQDRKSWVEQLSQRRTEAVTGWDEACPRGRINPYAAVRMIQEKVSPESIIVADTGANVCWVYQALLPHSGPIFTAGGNSPMGYSLPAAIGASLADPSHEVICFIGDGGLQMNIQELQTVIHYKLKVHVVVLNNFGYGIIKQFQDSNFEGRYFASGKGYSLPDFGKISRAYGLSYFAVTTLEDLQGYAFPTGASVLDIQLDENTRITPKVEMDRFLHDQFPYIDDSLSLVSYFDYPERPSQLPL